LIIYCIVLIKIDGWILERYGESGHHFKTNERTKKLLTERKRNLIRTNNRHSILRITDRPSTYHSNHHQTKIVVKTITTKPTLTITTKYTNHRTTGH